MTFHNVCTEGTFDSVIAKICINKIHFEWFFRSSGPLEPRHHPTYYSRNPMNDWFSIETHNHVYTNETFYSMYGWYGSNVHYMWKIVNFWWFLIDFWDLWSPDRTPDPTPDALWKIVLSLEHSIMYVPMRNLIQCMDDMALMPKICEK